MNRIILLGLVFFAVTACETINFPGGRFETPETTGKKAVDLHLQFSVDPNIEVESTLNDDVDSSLSMGLGGSFGLYENLDTYLRLAPSILGHTTSAAGLKLQLFGKNQTDAARGNFSAAIMAGLLLGESAYQEIENSFITYGTESALLVGFRPKPNTIIYTGPYYSDTRGRLSGETFAIDSPRGHTKGITAGVRIGRRSYSQLELTYTDILWNNTRDRSMGFGLSFGLHFK